MVCFKSKIIHWQTKERRYIMTTTEKDALAKTFITQLDVAVTALWDVGAEYVDGVLKDWALEQGPRQAVCEYYDEEYDSNLGDNGFFD